MENSAQPNQTQNGPSQSIQPPPPIEAENNSHRGFIRAGFYVALFLAVLAVGILAYQRYNPKISDNSQDQLYSSGEEASQPTQTPTVNEFVPDKNVICARFTDVENALNFIDQACVLDLSGQDLTEIPEGVYKLAKLNEIDLSNNKLTSIPLELIDMPSIISINLSNNNISSIAGVKNKTAPVISDPETTSAPFIGLQSLNLSGNPISEADQQKLKELFGLGNPSDPESSVVKF